MEIDTTGRPQITLGDIITFEGLVTKTKKFIPNYTPKMLVYKSNLHKAGFKSVRLYNKQETEINCAYIWCQENFGDNWVWNRLPEDYVEFFFINPLDAVAFRLKWG